jgi:hypothetical protein
LCCSVREQYGAAGKIFQNIFEIPLQEVAGSFVLVLERENALENERISISREKQATRRAQRLGTFACFARRCSVNKGLISLSQRELAL